MGNICAPPTTAAPAEKKEEPAAGDVPKEKIDDAKNRLEEAEAVKKAIETKASVQKAEEE